MIKLTEEQKQGVNYVFRDEDSSYELILRTGKLDEECFRASFRIPYPASCGKLGLAARNIPELPAKERWDSEKAIREVRANKSLKYCVIGFGAGLKEPIHALALISTAKPVLIDPVNYMVLEELAQEGMGFVSKAMEWQRRAVDDRLRLVAKRIEAVRREGKIEAYHSRLTDVVEVLAGWFDGAVDLGYSWHPRFDFPKQNTEEKK